MLTNRQLAEIFTLIADLSEIKGEVIYKTLAYRRVAENLGSLPREAGEYWKEGKLEDIPGVGKAIGEKIDELMRTGKLKFLTELKKEVPGTLADWLKIPGLGPKKAGAIWKALDISTLPQLEKAARAGKLRGLPGMGEKSEAAILDGIESLARRGNRIPLGVAWPLAKQIIAQLKDVPGVVAVEPAGSLRRMKPTVGDIDILAAAEDSTELMRTFTKLPGVHRVLGQGPTKSSIEFADGTRAQLWVHPPRKFGTALQYATGSKEHNVRLRQLALDNGLSLSEHALTKVKGGKEILCEREEQVYQALGLQWVPPELREDRGEVQAAAAGELPKLIEVADIKADLHMHSTYSDGKLSIREMTEAAMRRGLQVIAFTDHSIGLGVTGGMTIAEHKKQAAEIRKVQAEVGDRIRILHGSEVEILADGTLAYPDEFLATLDIVIASPHMSLRQPREKIMMRLLQTVANPHVDILGHPTGRKIPDREGADVDLEALLQAAARSGIAMEINAHPVRLDLDDVGAGRARELGVPIAINTDAHREAHLDELMYGVAIGRRAWLQPRHVLNCMPPAKLLKWLEGRG